MKSEQFRACSGIEFHVWTILSTLFVFTYKFQYIFVLGAPSSKWERVGHANAIHNKFGHSSVFIAWKSCDNDSKTAKIIWWNLARNAVRVIGLISRISVTACATVYKPNTGSGHRFPKQTTVYFRLSPNHCPFGSGFNSECYTPIYVLFNTSLYRLSWLCIVWQTVGLYIYFNRLRGNFDHYR